ncbi:polysaccharide deacetylase family protein [Spirillospora albida]|uniref:polysaccharide deacetylase family protein n=1 Tax=Spirillospora albida TaxID=58123 RepID=UPI001FDFCCF1|nr:polysaccharide deacetylase family protein [Spirillospora albida]
MPTAALPASAQAAAVKANEMGQVPVIMYHRILDRPELPLDRSGAELYAELTRLAKSGYVPITAAQLAAGWVDVPAGRHPVVLTFDDSTPGHFGLDAQGAPKPETAVGIIHRVARENPGFRPVATFYLNEDVFGLDGAQAAAGLKWLVQNGFELGNHTVNHPDLSGLSAKEVAREIGGMEDRIRALTGLRSTTLAYPFGAVPRDKGWRERYPFKGVFLAGWRPSDSPFADEFDRWAIHRVRSEGKIKENDCTKFCSTAWLDHLDEHPDERYTSDGDPRTVVFPKMLEDRLAKGYLPWARVY